MKLTLGRPEHSDRISEFYRQVHDQSFAHPELLSSETLARLITDEALAVVIASSGQMIIGCGVAFLQTWNSSLEIGAISVASVENRSAVGKALFEALRRLGAKRYGVAFFRAPSESAFKRGMAMGASCWGYRPAPGSAQVNKAELIMGFPPAGEYPRVEPPHNELTKRSFVRRLVASSDIAEEGIPYPKSFPVGCPQGTGAPVISGRVWPTYHSRGNYIQIENAAGAFPVEIIREFTERVEKKGVRDVRVTLPANQDGPYLELLDFGFRPVAYLPGWFLRGAYRFDCVQMIRGGPSIPRRAETFMERAVKKIDDDFS